MCRTSRNPPRFLDDATQENPEVLPKRAAERRGNRSSQCQWQLNTAHFWQLKTAHFWGGRPSSTTASGCPRAARSERSQRSAVRTAVRPSPPRRRPRTRLAHPVAVAADVDDVAVCRPRHRFTADFRAPPFPPKVAPDLKRPMQTWTAMAWISHALRSASSSSTTELCRAARALRECPQIEALAERLRTDD